MEDKQNDVFGYIVYIMWRCFEKFEGDFLFH